MTIELSRPVAKELSEVVETLRGWQVEDAPFQLHPGDLGWAWGWKDGIAALLRTWRQDGELLAIGMLDGPDLLRLALAPHAQHDERLAQQVVRDVANPAAGVLPAGEASLEAPLGALVHELLGEEGWDLDEPWTVLRRELILPVEDPGVRIETIGPQLAHVWAGVYRAAFGNTRLTEQQLVERWETLMSGLPAAESRSLVAFDEDDQAVAAVIVWPSGPGRSGILEPMGTHPDHRGHGYGTAISLAAAAALRELGASAATVATHTSNVGAVATYEAAGFVPVAQRHDRHRAG
jgi:GNAT superfamily N-acetyltransferase